MAALKGLRLPLETVDVAELACSVVDAIHLGGLPLRLPPPLASRWSANIASSRRCVSERSSSSIKVMSMNVISVAWRYSGSAVERVFRELFLAPQVGLDFVWSSVNSLKKALILKVADRVDFAAVESYSDTLCSD